MRHANHSPPRRGGNGTTGGASFIRRCALIDLVAASFFSALLLFLLLTFTPLGDPLAASGRRYLGRQSASFARQREKVIAAIELGEEVVIESCPAEEVDKMPCEDPRRNSLFDRYMNFYRERHCPAPGEALLCLVPPPKGYRVRIPWPESLHKIWHNNMPYNKISERKGHQGWMTEEGPYFIFPGGGTMFPDGAEQYIEKLGQYIPIKKGILRTALDMGCGVASFGGFLLKENLLTLSFAPRDSHKSQIQFALERGIPAFVAMLGTRRLPFPAYAFDLIHCSRCLIPFTAYNGSYIVEVDRLLRPGGYLVISGPPVKWAKQESEWDHLQAAALALCYKLLVVDGNTAIWKKPSIPSCLQENKLGIGYCRDSNDPSEAWYFKLNACVNKNLAKGEFAVGAIPKWPDRLLKPSPRLSLTERGDSFEADTELWARRVEYYKKSLGIKLESPSVRNVMDMNANLGGFSAALSHNDVWVMNVVPVFFQLTLDVIYDRGLIGVYHDWCEAFSTYPRTYDLLHVSGISSLVADSSSNLNRCHLVDLMVEMDRILRPKGTAVIRDSMEVIDKVAQIARAIKWTTDLHQVEPESPGDERILVITKNFVS
ncbi:probable methyltransferase PMT13 [Dendrobium catenatum]|uniref:Methyltransferase n=1 Tax=Dendrobium catenatum TaxID=906689 RepID=A0A2I0WMQ3_9ASPA|nr:probable methyltransferase PMT13 [Dendrobium catenatum]PKU76944.1 putative methyltransferase PMT13 [Dendrobium catenatum]